MKVKLTFPVLALALAAIALVASPNVFAADIDFSCSSGQGTTTSGNICSSGAPVTTSPVTLLTWTEYGYTVTNTTTPASDWVYNPNQGDLPPGTTGLGGSGNDSLSVADGGDFLFSGVNIGSNNQNGQTDNLFYTITGSLGSVIQFTENGEICDTAEPCPLVGGQATYYFIGGNADTIDKLTISLTDDGRSPEYLDNIQVTPEPASVLLFGTGLLGLAFIAFRKVKASGLKLGM
jgi:hypothetical protein